MQLVLVGHPEPRERQARPGSQEVWAHQGFLDPPDLLETQVLQDQLGPVEPRVL